MLTLDDLAICIHAVNSGFVPLEQLSEELNRGGNSRQTFEQFVWERGLLSVAQIKGLREEIAADCDSGEPGHAVDGSRSLTGLAPMDTMPTSAFESAARDPEPSVESNRFQMQRTSVPQEHRRQAMNKRRFRASPDPTCSRLSGCGTR